jgi:ammonia channel protein AmtB
LWHVIARVLDDDSLDVFGVHAVGGALGAIGTGILMSTSLDGIDTRTAYQWASRS